VWVARPRSASYEISITFPRSRERQALQRLLHVSKSWKAARLTHRGDGHAAESCQDASLTIIPEGCRERTRYHCP
jgi:hypothetical protein